MIRVALVDDQELVRAGFRAILETTEDILVVAEAADGQQAIEALERTVCNVVVMDIRMPRLDGIEATRRITARPEPPAVLILTTFGEDDYVYEALRAGASGFLLKEVPREQLVYGIRVIASGEALISATVTRNLIARYLETSPDPGRRAATLVRLSDREQEVFVALASGDSNREIAERLYLSEATVKSHVTSIFSKLEVRDRVHAVIVAYEAGIVTPGGPRC